MKIIINNIEKICPESEVFESVLSLDQQNILELGCGDAKLTRLIAQAGKGRTITAAEVDSLQHNKNLLINDLSNVSFMLAGSEKIPAVDKCFDTVFMFKSFHHVPVELMLQALQEIKRVLKPGGQVYISEPLFSGEFNELLSLFHNEEQVRQAAFSTIKQAVADKLFTLQEELFFNTPLCFDNFAQYEKRVIGATYSEHQLSDELYARVKQKFAQAFAKNKGNFIIPIRVDLLTTA